MNRAMMMRRSTGWACALLAVGTLVAGTGCDGLDAALTFSVDVARDTATSAIHDAVTDLIGDVVSGADGT